MSDHNSQLDSTETPGDTELLLGKISDAILLFNVWYIEQVSIYLTIIIDLCSIYCTNITDLYSFDSIDIIVQHDWHLELNKEN